VKTLTGKAITLSISGLSNATRLRGGMQIFCEDLNWQNDPACRLDIQVVEQRASSWRHANFGQDFAGKTLPLAVSANFLQDLNKNHLSCHFYIQ
jgi:hypothetical protein